MQGRPFVIRDVCGKQERVQPPLLYDLTELQRDMNRRHGMSADATLKAAQVLTRGRRSRTRGPNLRDLGSDMKTEIPGILRDLRPIRPDEIGRLDLEALPFSGQIINDKKVSDHHAIIPTGKAGRARPGDCARSSTPSSPA